MAAPTYLFGPREKRGLILGIGARQAAGLLGGVLLAVCLLLAIGGSLGVIVAAALLVTVAAATFVPVAGRPMTDWAPVAIGNLVRPSRWRSSAPAAGIPVEGAVEAGPAVPAQLAGVRLLSVTHHGRPVGVLLDGYHAVGVLRVRARSFALREDTDQARLLAEWAGVLAGFARTSSPIDRVQVLERTGLEDTGSLRRHLDQQSAADADPAAVAGYRELLDAAGPAATAHEMLLAVRLDPSRCRRLVRAAGGRHLGAARVLAREVDNVAAQLQSVADLYVDEQLSPGELAGLVRVGFDPSARGRPGLTVGSGVGVSAAWPLAAEEGWSTYRTDGAVHTTFWVEELPRVEVRADFLGPLLLRTHACRAVSVTFAPVDERRALRKAEQAMNADEADDELRARYGLRATARANREAQTAARREQELADGHALMRLSAYVTVSAPTVEELDRACGEVENAAAQSRLRLRRLYGEQAATFTFGALPLCRGVR